MLKQYISLFCEKFLQKKSEYISNQAMPDDSAEPVQYTPSSSPGEIIAPFDGYVTFYTRCYEWAQLWNGSRGVLISAKGTTYERIQMSIAKGSKVGYEYTNPVQGVQEAYLVFTPTIGCKK